MRLLTAVNGTTRKTSASQQVRQLSRSTLPQIEITLNKNVADGPANVILGEIAWHLSAMASLYHLSLNDVITFNCEKVRFRQERGQPTALHDEERDAKEQFPRCFQVAFVRVGPRRSRMYFDGKPLGDDLTDNFYEDDGYRFHDVIHLALIAHLGWSPVVRGLMKRKRKSRNDRVDEVEDGGRAQVVEELVIKAIHSNGDRQARAAGRCIAGRPTRLFSDRSLINIHLLKTVRAYVDGLEVAKNRFWEWEDSIFNGCDMFFQLSNEKQGTVHVDLEKRRLTFSPNVSPNLQGITVGLGMGTAPVETSAVAAGQTLSPPEVEWAAQRNRTADTLADKHAILAALGLPPDDQQYTSQLEVRLADLNGVYVKASKEVQERMWSLRAVDYKTAFARSSGQVICTATAIADVRDVSK